jgi:TolB-like protein/DNA-binding winged helix-turn-helix (wHTH) protein/tetratricopeptide (TPR) repeat protein
VRNGFHVGHWTVHPDLNAVSENGTATHLEPKVMDVLVCLAETSGEVVNKEVLIHKVWPDTFVSDDVLKRSISELRRVFKDDARDARIIETIPKRGYRLLIPVEPLTRSAAQTGPAREKLVTPPVPPVPRHRVLWLATTLSIVGIGSLAAWLFLSNVAGLRDRLLGTSTPVIRSLAVLPIRNLSADPKQEYLAEGVTDSLITALAQIGALKVVSRTSVVQFQGTTLSLPEIARELHVDAIVEGTLQRSGDQVRITAQVIYAPADRHLWAGTFDGDVQDVFSLQSSVAQVIADEIRISISPAEQARMKSVRQVSAKALNAYVEARFHIDQAAASDFFKEKRQVQRDETTKALFYLDQSVREDPNYLPAYVAYFDLLDAQGISRMEFLPRAKAALKKALRLDDTNLPAHLALGRLLLQFEYDWAGAENEYRRAIQVAPDSGQAHYHYSEYLAMLGRNNDADKERDIAQTLDPSHDYFSDAGVHRLDHTLEQDREALEEKAPTDPFALGALAKDYATAHRYEDAVQLYERCLSLYGWNDFVVILKNSDIRGGPKFALEQWMRAVELYSQSHDDFPVFVPAFTYNALNNRDRAFAWLDKAVAQRSWCIIYMRRIAGAEVRGESFDDWAALRSDPRFPVLLHRVGLPQ